MLLASLREQLFPTCKTFLQEIPAEYRLVAGLFAKSAAAVNPFIYFFMSAGFRRDTGNILHR